MLLFALLLLLSASPRSASAAEAEIPLPLADTVTEALVSWAQFAMTGDSAVLDSVFVVGGPQHRLLDEESSTWNSASGLEPLRLIGSRASTPQLRVGEGNGLGEHRGHPRRIRISDPVLGL